MAATRSGQVVFEAECSTVDVGAAECALLLGSLDKAASAVENAVVLKKELLIKLAAAPESRNMIGGQTGSSRRRKRGLGSVDVVAETSVPVYLTMPRTGSVLHPQALARQLNYYQKDKLGKWDAIISVYVPREGFYYEGQGTTTEQSSKLINFGALKERRHVFAIRVRN